MPTIPRHRPPIKSQVPTLTPRLAGVWAVDATGRSAIGTVGTAESAEEIAPAGGGAGGFAGDSLAAAAAAGAALWAFWSPGAGAVSFVSFVAFACGVRDALCADVERDVEDIDLGALVSAEGAAGAGAAVAPEDEVSPGETGATAGRFGIGDTWGAGAASDEDGG